MVETRKSGIVDVGVVGVPVTDQDRALDFYAEFLGFEVRVDAPTPDGGRWVMVAPPSASTSIALIASRPDLPSGVETGIRFVATDVAGVHEALLAHGVEVGELLQWPGVPAMFAFHDPDGNGMEIIEVRQESE